jgi:von Willebrand factor type A domain
VKVPLSRILVVACVCCLSACSAGSGAKSTLGAGNSGNASNGSGGSPVGSGGSTGSGGTGTIIVPEGKDAGEDTSCGFKNFDLVRKPAEILLVLDRSASMKDPADGTTTPRKWDLVVPAINQVITSTNSVVSWGMKSFPEGEGSECIAGSVTNRVDVPIAAMNAVTVTGAVTATTPEGNGTPTGDAVNAAVTYLQTLTDTNPKYIMLATDGEPSCPAPSATSRTYAVSAVMAAAAKGFHTFVVGVSTTKTTATQALNDMATAGLEPRPAANPLETKFYLASTQDALVAAMQAITGQVTMNCVFQLDTIPPAPDYIAVKVNGTNAPRDTTHADGWDYTGPDFTAVQVYGSWCEQIKGVSANMVHIVYGCINVPPP